MNLQVLRTLLEEWENQIGIKNNAGRQPGNPKRENYIEQIIMEKYNGNHSSRQT